MVPKRPVALALRYFRRRDGGSRTNRPCVSESGLERSNGDGRGDARVGSLLTPNSAWPKLPRERGRWPGTE